ncbi:MAG: 2,3-bisphosphoglycerate-independent phosphoglycerate mutase [Clostridia bacterium]|jgi:2,3-bisphosphoglycerate-independent phosphoglycerate mutase|nr:2,3-bisphosphoglycerate-independent phosphoglycerate mutase [Clostridia bacterium]MCI9413022.1 2,3-bisphosphoglycerate-independent phosphoglycerate mutase [Clostridia bacterium]
MRRKPMMLMILDGFGINEIEKANAVKLANTPNIDNLMKTWPTTEIHTSGLEVGLPDGQMGNSEVGHTNIGAGRVVYQDLTRITKSIEDGDFFSVKEITEAIENCQRNHSKLHIIGLLSDGGVHSHIRHLVALLEAAKRKDFEDVYVHCFLDGRDTPPASGEGYIAQLEEKMREKEVGKIASISGRFYSMDRDKRWDRVEKAYNALVKGEGEKATSAISAIESSYQQEVFDEFVLPTVICNNSNEPLATIQDNDSVIFFNYRPDRAREITRSLVDPEFEGFETKPLNLYYVCFTQYDETIPNVHIAFKPESLKNTFGEYVSNQGLTQLRIAETEKYAHVTFFFNGGEEKQYPGEDRILVPSPKVQTYDMQPEMSAVEVTDKVVEAIRSDKYDCIILNYANPDMVGHTGNLEAAIKAIETIDECVARVVAAIEEKNGMIIMTADHGNAEQMIDYKTGEPHTAHTTNIVPLVLIGVEGVQLKSGKLADLAPTMLELMGLQKPEEMTGESIIDN